MIELRFGQGFLLALLSLLSTGLDCTEHLAAQTTAEVGTDELPAGDGSEQVNTSCTACHGLQVITARRRTPRRWEEILDRMVSEGLAVNDTERKVILDYLSSRLAPSPTD